MSIEKLKEKLGTLGTLAIPQREGKYILITDASDS
jgi:hypothetical protein